MKMEIFFEDNKKVNVNLNGRIIRTDQPLTAGGDDTAPSPFDLFLSSIGTCAGFYVKSFCDQRNISSSNIKIEQEVSFNPQNHLAEKIRIDIKLPSDFPEKYKNAVINSANLCTVKKHLMNPPQLDVTASIHEAEMIE